MIEDKYLFVIRVKKSEDTVLFRTGEFYLRKGGQTLLNNSSEINQLETTNEHISKYTKKLSSINLACTESFLQLLSIYNSKTRIINYSEKLLFHNSISSVPIYEEGKILVQLIFSSILNNFERYLSALLIEIFIAKPDTLKSESTLTTKEILDCEDIGQIVKVITDKRIDKLQKGNIKGFIENTSQIKKLNAINEDELNELEELMEIRHLFTHNNGIVDRKFLKKIGGDYEVGQKYEINVEKTLNTLTFLYELAKKIDSKAIDKYKLQIFV